MGDKLFLSQRNLLSDTSLLAWSRDQTSQYNAVSLDPLLVWSTSTTIDLLIDLTSTTSSWDVFAMLGTTFGQGHTWRLRGYSVSTVPDWVQQITINTDSGIAERSSDRIMLTDFSGWIGWDSTDQGWPTDYIERVAYTGPPRYPLVPTIQVRGSNPVYYYGYGPSDRGGLSLLQHYPDITQYRLFSAIWDTGVMPVMGPLAGAITELNTDELPVHLGAYWRRPETMARPDLLRVEVTRPAGSAWRNDVSYMWLGPVTEISVRTELAWDTVDLSDRATGPNGIETELVGDTYRTLEIPMERYRRHDYDLLQARLRAAGPDRPCLVYYESDAALTTQERSGLYYPTKRHSAGKVAGYGRAAGSLQLRERKVT